jgi:glycosyltransferase involved in cell wall biosynthesis
MKLQINHIITTIDNGGAENQLALLINEQIRSGLIVQVMYLKKIESINPYLNNSAALLKRITFVELVRFLLKRKPPPKPNSQIIHAHLPRAEIYGYLISLKTGSPLIITRHNTESFIPGHSGSISRILSTIIVNRSKRVICISNAVKEYLVENRECSDTKKMKVIFYGLPKMKEEQISKGKKRNDKKPFIKIFTAARLVEQKNLINLVRSLSFLPNEFILEIAGEGPQQEMLEMEISRLNLAKRVNLLGKVTGIRKNLQESDVFVLASNYEGFGLVLLEAMEVGCKIATSQIAIFKELLGENYSFFFNQLDPRDIARTIKKLSKVSQLDNYWSSKVNKFSIEETEYQTRQVYFESLP